MTVPKVSLLSAASKGQHTYLCPSSGGRRRGRRPIARWREECADLSSFKRFLWRGGVLLFHQRGVDCVGFGRGVPGGIAPWSYHHGRKRNTKPPPFMARSQSV